MKQKKIFKEIAKLESINDHLITELEFINKLLILGGFSNGIESVKSAALEIIQNPDINKNAE